MYFRALLLSHFGPKVLRARDGRTALHFRFECWTADAPALVYNQVPRNQVPRMKDFKILHSQTILAVVIHIGSYGYQRNELYTHDFSFRQAAVAANQTINYRLPTMGSESKDQPTPPQLPLQAAVLYEKLNPDRIIYTQSRSLCL